MWKIFVGFLLSLLLPTSSCSCSSCCCCCCCSCSRDWTNRQSRGLMNFSLSERCSPQRVGASQVTPPPPKATLPPPRHSRAFLREYEPLVSLNDALKGIFLGGWLASGGGYLKFPWNNPTSNDQPFHVGQFMNVHMGFDIPNIFKHSKILDPSFILLMVQKFGDHQLRLVVYPIIYRVLYIPGGAGFLPSIVSTHLLPAFPMSWTHAMWKSPEALGMSSLGLWWFGQPHRGCNRGLSTVSGANWQSRQQRQQRLRIADKERGTWTSP